MIPRSKKLMRSLGVHFILKPKRSSLFGNKSSCIQLLLLKQQQHRLCASKSCSSSYSLSVTRDTVGITNALKLSTDSKSSIIGRQVHAHIIKLGFSNHTCSQNNLIKMYSECGVLTNGLKVFHEMPERNLVSWTLIISAAIQNNESEMALEMYLDMARTGLMPNEFALGSLMKVCTSLCAYVLGLCVHCFVLKIGMEKNPFVVSSIMHMYAKSGDIESAEQAFDCMDCDVGCWNTMIGGYVQCGCGFEAVETVSLMHLKGIVMDNFTFINALKGCSVLGSLNFGRQIHGLIVRSEVECTSLMNSLMDMYFKTGGKEPAWKLFNAMQRKDVVSWNTIFAGLSKDISARKVANFVNKFMFTNLKPNHVTFSILFRLCGEALELNLGLQFFSLASKFGFQGEAHVASSLINMFSRCGAMDMAHLVFESVPLKNTNNWNEIIYGYSLNCDLEALKIFCNLWEMRLEANECTFSSALEACFRTGSLQICRQIHGIVVKSGFACHGYICSSLIKGYVKFGLLDDSFKFVGGPERLDIVSYGTMISALVHQGCISEAIEVLNCLKEDGREPDEFILGSILNGCASIASHRQTKSVHAMVIKLRVETNVFVATAVIDAYGKCGDIVSSRMVFDQSSRFRDVVLFNSMIMAYAHHGLVVEAMEIFEKMKLANLLPSQATFVSAISACSHMGLVDQGRELFNSITSKYGMKPSPDNYGCLVDLLSRNGFLQEAKHIIEVMPFPPWPAIYRSFLNGCRIHGNRDLGEWAAKKLFRLVPDNDAAYILLSKVYSEDGNWENAAKVRRRMITRGVRKDSGCSWVECQ